MVVVVTVALNIHTRIPVTQFLQCVDSRDTGPVVRWLRPPMGSSAEISVLSLCYLSVTAMSPHCLSGLCPHAVCLWAILSAC